MFGARAGRPLSELGAAQALLQPLLMDAPADAMSGLPAEAAVPRMQGSTTVNRSRRLGVYWEAYGLAATDTVEIALALSREGAMLTRVFATNSICTPSRAAILTGQYAHINGVTMFNRFDSNRMTVARLLRAGGYYTGMIGTWHLGSDPQGFDFWAILPGQGVYNDPVFYTATAETTYTGRYVTDVITDIALDFLKQRPKGKPFFLMMHHKAPHRPWDPDDRRRG